MKRARSFYGPVLLAAGLYAFILAFPLLAPILLAFLLTLLFTFAFYPLVAWLRARSGKQSLALTVLILGGLAGLGLVGWMFASPLRNSAGALGQRLPEYWTLAQRRLLKIEHREEISHSQLQREVAKEVAAENSLTTNAPTPRPVERPPQPGLISTAQSQILSGIGGSFKLLAANAATFVLVIITAAFGTLLALAKLNALLASFLAIIPATHHAVTVRILRQIVHVIPRWLLATLLAMATVGILVFLCMWPLFGFTDALTLGLLAAALEMIHFVGPVLMAIPALLLALNVGGWMPLWVALIYLAIQTVEGNIIAPLILSGRLTLHPIAVLFSIFFFFLAFGVLGVLLAAPAVAIATILRDELYRPRYLPNVTDADLDQRAAEVLRR